MPIEKPLNEKTKPDEEVISEDQDFWSRQFLKYIEFNLLDKIARLPQEASLSDYQTATIEAVIETLCESGMGIEQLPELLATALASINKRSENASKQPWSESMNDRRMELIDKVIQEAITVPEQIELARLTQAMREVVDAEATMPMKGARDLHQKLLSIQRGESGD